MNKSQLVDALADRLGDRRTAAGAVDALLQIVVDTVRAGDSVSLAGFGVFESRARAARTGRNPRTGETVDVPATTVPAFRPGTGFRNAVAGEDARRQPAAAAVTNGAGGQETGTVLHGTVELTPATTSLLAAPPDEDPETTRPGKGKSKKAVKDAVRAVTRAKDAKDKGKKKGKKGK